MLQLYLVYESPSERESCLLYSLYLSVISVSMETKESLNKLRKSVDGLSYGFILTHQTAQKLRRKRGMRMLALIRLFSRYGIKPFSFLCSCDRSESFRINHDAKIGKLSSCISPKKEEKISFCSSSLFNFMLITISEFSITAQ